MLDLLIASLTAGQSAASLPIERKPICLISATRSERPNLKRPIYRGDDVIIYDVDWANRQTITVARYGKCKPAFLKRTAYIFNDTYYRPNKLLGTADNFAIEKRLSSYSTDSNVINIDKANPFVGSDDQCVVNINENYSGSNGDFRNSGVLNIKYGVPVLLLTGKASSIYYLLFKNCGENANILAYLKSGPKKIRYVQW